ncbi:MAG TPA: ribosome biogenesis GTP-binding protein YihA/YsxC [Saprospiraceae bacterium]|nr:ribosome biogenesis GTP-binding protein YihA/YsxC [Saprospiraceae bacterium]
MEIRNAEYVASFVREDQCPKSTIPEFAFIGRSNVGKSSLINMLTNKKELAKVSKQPGKTQKLNYFIIDDTWHLVDLPGYGYAKVSKKQREEWGRMIKFYLRVRSQLTVAFVLLDARQTVQKIDIDFINWCGSSEVPIVIVYTKCDKVNEGQLNKNIESIRTAILEMWEEMPKEFFTSAQNNTGREELLNYIGSLIEKSAINEN